MITFTIIKLLLNWFKFQYTKGHLIYRVKTFDDIKPEDHKEICIKVLKYWLKNYYKLDGIVSPQSSILKQDDINGDNSYPGDSFCLKLDIERAINKLPLRLKKVIYLFSIIGYPVGKICLMLGFKFRVDLYRRLEECFDCMYEELGTDWLRSQELSLGIIPEEPRRR